MEFAAILFSVSMFIIALSLAYRSFAGRGPLRRMMGWKRGGCGRHGHHWQPGTQPQAGMPLNKLDSKFTGRLCKVKNGEVVPEDEWCVFLAKDTAFANVLPDYRKQCELLGADAEQLASVDRLISRVQAWRAVYLDRCKTPDAKGEKQLDQPAPPVTP